MADRPLSARMKKMHISEVDPFKPYPMNKSKMGVAVIINNINKELPSSTVDVEALQESYEKVGFEVQVHNDCDARTMGRIKREILKDETHADKNSFLLTIICHGNDKGHLLDKDKKRAWVLEDFIGDLSLVDSLMGKPKILVVQSCRGVEWSEGKRVQTETLADDEDIEVPIVLPDKSDMFVAYATVPGYRAHKGDDTGSAYLQAFAAYLERHYMNQDLDAIYSMVNQYMASIKHGESGMRQVSEKRSSLRFPLKFSEFHQKSSATASSRSELKHTPPPVPPKPRQNEEAESEMREMRERLRKLEEQELARKQDEQKRKLQKAAILSLAKINPNKSTVSTLNDVTLKLLTTQDTGLSFWAWTLFTVMSSGQVVLWGKTSDENPPAFHIFSLTSAVWKKLREVKRLCDHDNVYILPITGNNKEQLAVSCWNCKTIKLYNLDTLQVTTAFHDPEYYPSKICHGESGKLYIVHSVEGYPVLELDCSQETFSGPSKIVQSKMETYNGMYYIPAPHRLIVLSNYTPGIIRAVSAETGEKVWEVKGQVDGVECEPLDLLFSPQHQVLLAADGWNKRLLVLHPGDGSHLQTLQIGQEMGAVNELCLPQNKLVVRHTAESKEKVSYFSVN